MIGASLVGGPYDGAHFSFVDRMPEKMVLEIEVTDVDTDDPVFQEAFRENVEVEPSLEISVFVRNARSLTASYVLDSYQDGTSYFRFSRWSLAGTDSKT